MIKVKHVLLCFVSLLLCMNLSSVVLASTTSSQVGIYFTEKIEEKNEDISNSLDEKSDRTSLYLPQTGEHKNQKFTEKIYVLLLGIFLLIVSITKKKKRSKINEIKNDDCNGISWKHIISRIG